MTLEEHFVNELGKFPLNCVKILLPVWQFDKIFKAFWGKNGPRDLLFKCDFYFVLSLIYQITKYEKYLNILII